MQARSGQFSWRPQFGECGGADDEGPETSVIHLPTWYPALGEGGTAARLLRTVCGRREIFLTARNSLLAMPALIHLCWLFGPVFRDRQEACPEEFPWGEQAEIDRRDFFRKACDSLGAPRAMGQGSDTRIRESGRGYPAATHALTSNGGGNLSCSQ